MKTSYDIILRPVITEDSMARVPSKCYTFEVAKSATKAEIAKAVEVGVHFGYTSEWKKAIVTLTADSKTIEFFDGMM